MVCEWVQVRRWWIQACTLAEEVDTVELMKQVLE